MNEYVTDILLENAKSTLDEKLRSLRDEYRNKGVPTLLTESLNELPIIKSKMSDGAILFADNVLYRGYITGEVKAPHRQNTIKNNMREFLRLISTDSDFITTVSDIGDGVSVSYKKEKEA